MCVRKSKKMVVSHYFLPHQESASCKDGVSVCFLNCSSFLASSCCQTIQGSSHCLPMHPDPAINGRCLSPCSASSIGDLFLPAYSFHFFLLTFDNHFSSILIWSYRISSLIEDMITSLALILLAVSG